MFMAYFWNFAYRRKMGAIGADVSLGRGLRIDGPQFIFLGDRVRIDDYCRFAIPGLNFQAGAAALALSPKLEIGSDTYVGSFTVFNCMNAISIGKKVAIADHCYIGDYFHGFVSTDLPPIDQYLVSRGPVRINDGAWLGSKVSVMPGVTIGRHCIIGANSVVTHDIPDFHVAVGAPARAIRRLDRPNPAESNHAV
jgi:acetyltransferase-like isoleucine patch superfamily enzyme